MGFFVASVALSRSALEAGLKPAVGKYLGTPAAAKLELKELIDRATFLDTQTRDLAHQLRKLGNKVVHDGKAASADETLFAFEAARTIVGYLSRI